MAGHEKPKIELSAILWRQLATNSKFGKAIVGFLLATAASVYLVVSNYSRIAADSWIYGEWLISYADGFQRRGLSGTLIFLVADTIGLKPLDVVFVLQSIFVLLCLWLLFQLVTANPVPLIVLLGVISPMATLYFLVEPAVVGRKEIVFYSG
jgi:hypothetical protein